MTNRRGIPKEITSANGTNLEKELRKLTSEIVKNPKFVATTASKKIKWKFNPPYTPTLEECLK